MPRYVVEIEHVLTFLRFVERDLIRFVVRVRATEWLIDVSHILRSESNLHPERISDG